MATRYNGFSGLGEWEAMLKMIPKNALDADLTNRLEDERTLAQQLSTEFPNRPFRVYLVNRMVWTRCDREPKRELEGHILELKYTYVNGQLS